MSQSGFSMTPEQHRARRRAAHERAALVHDRAALTHEEAASLFDALGRTTLAELHRTRADQQRANALLNASAQLLNECYSPLPATRR